MYTSVHCGLNGSICNELTNGAVNDCFYTDIVFSCPSLYYLTMKTVKQRRIEGQVLMWGWGQFYEEQVSFA